MITVSMVNPRIIYISVVSLYARCHHRLQSLPLYFARNYHPLIMHRLLLNNLEFLNNIFDEFYFEYLSHQNNNISLSTLNSFYQSVDAFCLVLPVHQTPLPC